MTKKKFWVLELIFGAVIVVGYLIANLEFFRFAFGFCGGCPPGGMCFVNPPCSDYIGLIIILVGVTLLVGNVILFLIKKKLKR